MYEIEGKRIFVMGGASSHDKQYRTEGKSWWRQELPSQTELDRARANLDAAGWTVDIGITHCAPTGIALSMKRHNEADRLTDFLQTVREKLEFHYWLFGHYHRNEIIDEKYVLLYEQLVRVL